MSGNAKLVFYSALFGCRANALDRIKFGFCQMRALMNYSRLFWRPTKVYCTTPGWFAMATPGNALYNLMNLSLELGSCKWRP